MKLNPDVFERAASNIERYGWSCVWTRDDAHAAAVKMPAEEKARVDAVAEAMSVGTDPMVMPPAGWRMPDCLGNALSAVAGNETKPGYRHYLTRLCRHLGVSEIFEVYKLNDARPDYWTGKAWAIAVLRALASNVRQENRDVR